MMVNEKSMVFAVNVITIKVTKKQRGAIYAKRNNSF